MFWRWIGASLLRDPRRKSLALVAVTLGVLAATALTTVLLASGDRLAAELAAYGANLEVVPPPGEETFEVAELLALRDIFWRNNIIAVAPQLPLRVRFGTGEGTDGPVAPLVGTWFDVALEDGWRTGLPAARPALQVAGRWPRDGAAEVVLGRRLAARLGAEPGDEVHVALGDRQRQLRLVGVVTSGEREDDEAFAPLPVVQALAGRAGARVTGVPTGPATHAEVFALTEPESERVEDPTKLSPDEYERWYCVAYPSAIAFQIDEAMPGAQARVVTGVADPASALLLRLARVLLALAVVVLLGAGLGVAAVTTSTMLERRREAGLLVALGAEGWRVILLFAVESAAVGLLGGLLGGAGGLVAGRYLGLLTFGTAIPWMPVLLVPAVGAGVLVALAGAVVPLTRVFSEQPVLALKEVPA